MKNLFLALTLASGSFAFAQEKSSKSSVAVGLKSGLNISTVSSSASKSKAGFYGGFFVNFSISSSISIQPEVLYNGLGAKKAADTDLKSNLDYISVPVMFQYRVIPQLFLEAGPQFSFLVNAKYNFPSSVNAKDVVKTFDFGLGLGTGYYFTHNFGLTARYFAGITNIIEEGAPVNTSKGRNNVFQIGLVYKFK
ncbi:Outer membrane protein beta-barrel domain-containing protein [Chryseobacterium oleae]|uniref:Outer membrane protein beta-barrel domain-containing protein n=1 Tax=Chryseobacterium oleae TaxID=491207 RepID=A0A1I4YSD1_CHROL|nr:porin family protein [Chryseobacterium oleae]SFN40877.1 Outer membrane protein beta-barrel domain-containing protein [Chryseobacterium oleae]